jgi:hypothetical protein
MASRVWETGLGERNFVWQRTSPLRDRYELRARDRTLATLSIGGPPFTSTQLESGDLRMVFTAGGVGQRRVRIVDPAASRWSPPSTGGGRAGQGPCSSRPVVSSSGAVSVGGGPATSSPTGSGTRCCASTPQAA